MKTPGAAPTVLRWLIVCGGFVAFLGVCAVGGGVVSETPEGVAVGWLVAAVGIAVAGLAALLLLTRRSRRSRS